MFTIIIMYLHELTTSKCNGWPTSLITGYVIIVHEDGRFWRQLNLEDEGGGTAVRSNSTGAKFRQSVISIS